MRLILFCYMIDQHRLDHTDADILTELAALGGRDQIVRGTFALAVATNYIG